MNTPYSIAERTQRWSDFLLNGDGGGHMFLITYAPDQEPPPLPWPDLEQERIEYAVRDYERQVARQEWLCDDALPFVHVRTGTEIFAEAFGCAVHYPPDTNPFALPLITSAKDVAALKVPEVSSSTLARLFGMVDRVLERVGTDALVKIVDIQSPMDIAALIWDKTSFYTAMVQEPAAVKALAAIVKELFVAFVDEWFARYGTQFIAHYPSYYMPFGITLSEDEVGAVNSGMFDQFFLPELAELSQRYGGIGIHCCANARHQWGGFKRIPDLRLLNLVQPPEMLQQAYTYFAYVVPQMHSWCGDDEPWSWPDSYPEGSRVVIQATAETKDEAQALSDKLWRACGRA